MKRADCTSAVLTHLLHQSDSLTCQPNPKARSVPIPDRWTAYIRLCTHDGRIVPTRGFADLQADRLTWGNVKNREDQILPAIMDMIGMNRASWRLRSADHRRTRSRMAARFSMYFSASTMCCSMMVRAFSASPALIARSNRT